VASEDIRRASLAGLREVRRGEPGTEDAALPPAFWEAAERVPAPRTSVHLKLDPEVFAFFKQGGKGHLTRMQNVLAAYARARKEQARRSGARPGRAGPSAPES
jgi:uncharacterized protein (DUF4415 family)